MFLDIGVGILVALLASFLFQVEISASLVIFSILFSLLPDVDFVYHLLRKGAKRDRKYDHEHRNLIHYPIIYLSSGTAIGWFFLGGLWGFLFFFASFFHFVHDSIGIGWGVRWLFPFSRKNYVFHYAHPEHKGRKRHLVFSFGEKELVDLVEKYGDPNWMKNIYFTWRHIFNFEFIFFIIAVLIFLLFLYV